VPAAADISAARPLRTTPVTFTLSENGFTSSKQTRQWTVGAALEESGITLRDADIVQPARDAGLTPGMRVRVDYAQRVEVLMGDKRLDVYTQAATVGEALHGAGIALGPLDQVFPSREKAVRNGMVIGLSLLRDVQVTEDIAIPHETTYRYDASLPKGQQQTIEAGADGLIRREYTVTQVNGDETARRMVSETRVEPKRAVVAIGTYVAPAAAAAAAPADAECPVRKTVWATYYTAASAGGNGITRTGTGVYKGIIATDPNFIPLGTKMYVPGYGYGVAADTGGGVKGWHVDLGYGADDVYDWGSRYVEICIY
jgi:3D (Asp-Asp-Asp) domain-containing protein